MGTGRYINVDESATLARDCSSVGAEPILGLGCGAGPLISFSYIALRI